MMDVCVLVYFVYVNDKFYNFLNFMYLIFKVENEGN